MAPEIHTTCLFTLNLVCRKFGGNWSIDIKGEVTSSILPTENVTKCLNTTRIMVRGEEGLHLSALVPTVSVLFVGGLYTVSV